MNNLLDNPDNFYHEVRRYTASVAAVLVFGHRGPTSDSFWARVSQTLVIVDYNKLTRTGCLRRYV
jgi:hypothetical protein